MALATLVGVKACPLLPIPDPAVCFALLNDTSTAD